MTSRRIVIGVVAVLALAAALAYLRDPPWLMNVTSGFSRWEADQSGGRYRWMAGHASFFVPAGARGIEIPLRARFDSPQDWPISATITIDDRPADRLVFTDDSWKTSRLTLPPRGTRRVRRIDIRVDRTRQGNRGLQVGEVKWEMGNGKWEMGNGKREMGNGKRSHCHAM